MMMHTSLPQCWLLLPFDSRSQRSQLLHDSHKANISLTHGYRTTVANTDSFKQANPMSYCAPVHIYLTTSINIRLTHGSCKTVANTRFHKKGQAYQKKAVRKYLLASLSNPIQLKKNSLYIHGHPNKLHPNGGDKALIPCFFHTWMRTKAAGSFCNGFGIQNAVPCSICGITSSCFSKMSVCILSLIYATHQS